MKRPAAIARAVALRVVRFVRRVVRIGVLGTAVAATLVVLDALLLRNLSDRGSRSLRD
jgi:hypothetical protein